LESDTMTSTTSLLTLCEFLIALERTPRNAKRLPCIALVKKSL
jgi:hypothetical protein